MQRFRKYESGRQLNQFSLVLGKIQIKAQMGNDKSSEYDSLVRNRQEDEWIVLNECDGYAIWKHRRTGTRYLVYSMDIGYIQSSQNLQMYAFRRQNSVNLVTIESILVNRSRELCEGARNGYLLVQYIPWRLQNITGGLIFQESLIVLNSVLSAYDLLNYVYGPVYTSANMICFNQEGFPKIWINQNLSLNQLSREAKGEILVCQKSNVKLGKGFQTKKQSENRIHQCLMAIFDIIQQSSICKFPDDLIGKLQKSRSYSQAQEFLSYYCMANNIKIGKSICFKRKNKKNIAYNNTILPTQQSQKNQTFNVFPYPSKVKSQCKIIFSPRITLESGLQKLKTQNLCGLKSEPTLRTSGSSNANIKIVYSRPARDSNEGKLSQAGHFANQNTQQNKESRDITQKQQKHENIKVEHTEEIQLSNQIRNIFNQSNQLSSCQKQTLDRPSSRYVDKLEQVHYQQIQDLFKSDDYKAGSIEFNSLHKNQHKYSEKTLEQLKIWEASLSKKSSKKQSFINIFDDRQDNPEKVYTINQKTDEGWVTELRNQRQLQNYMRTKYSEYLPKTLQNTPNQSVFLSANQSNRLQSDEEEEVQQSHEKCLNKNQRSYNNLLQSIIQQQNEDNQTHCFFNLIPVPIVPQTQMNTSRRTTCAADTHSQIENQQRRYLHQSVQMKKNKNRRNNPAYKKIDELYDKYVKKRVPSIYGPSHQTSIVNQATKYKYNVPVQKHSQTIKSKQLYVQKDVDRKKEAIQKSKSYKNQKKQRQKSNFKNVFAFQESKR